jgi:tetraacyldisaccharide 4'-kinase
VSVRAVRLLTVATAPLLPAMALGCLTHPRIRREIRGRFALEVPPVAPGCVWIHASSVGEVSAAEALAAALGGPVLVTADTDTGVARARGIQLKGVVGGVRPVDHPWMIAPLWAEARPRALVFIEGTWFPQLAWRAREAGIPVIRASAKTGARTRRMPGGMYRRWVRAADLVLARDAEEAAWFRAHQDAPVEVLGDLKSGGISRPNPLRWTRPFVVGASTRNGDEAALLDAVGEEGLLLAPRHPRRFDEVAALLDTRGLSWARRTEIASTVTVDVVLLDTLGELASCLVGAKVAFIGGTYDPTVGGHSPLEAARVGVPVVCGDQTHAHPKAFADCGALTVKRADLARGLQEACVRPVDTTTATRAAVRIRALLGDPAPEVCPRPWAQPLSVAFRGGARLRNAMYDQGVLASVRLAVPVISVGSANSRGPGKTTTVRWLAERLRAGGAKVGIALRGYGRTRRDRSVRLGGHVHDLGDEGALFAEAGFLVSAGADRVAAARTLMEAGADVILLDDGLQHRHLARDLDIVVVDARFPGGRMAIPAGEAREVGIPARADLVVVHHAGDGFEVAPTNLPMVQVRRVAGPWSRGGLTGPVAAFAGIGRPADFLDDLEFDVARFRALADHQHLDPALCDSLLAWADGLPLVCTAKDAVRLPPAFRSRIWSRDIRLEGDLPPAILGGLGL